MSIMDQIRDSASDNGPGWIAQNASGSWYWFSKEPTPNDKLKCWDSDGAEVFIREHDEYRLGAWQDSLEEV